VIVAVAAVALAGGFAALGLLTAPDPSAVAETTTTSTTTPDEVAPPIDLENFTVAQIVTGEQLVWEETGTFESLHPLGILEHEGDFYLFATRTPFWDVEPGGLMAWRSADAVAWEALGEVIGPDAWVGLVRSTPTGLMAAGTGPGTSGFVVWTSEDGAQWAATDVPVDTESPYLVTLPRIAGGSDDITVIAADTQLDSRRLIEDRLQAIGVDIDLSRGNWGSEWRGDEGHVLTVTGPLGIPIYEVALADLDLSDQEQEWVANGFEQRAGARIWVRQGTSRWEPGVVADAYTIQSILGRDDGTLLLFGFGISGPIARTSSDGLDWETIPGSNTLTGRNTPSAAEEWGDQFVALNADSQPDVLISEDGQSWQETGLSEHFPLPLNWWTNGFGAGADGIVISLVGGQSGGTEQLTGLPIITADDGASLIVDIDAGVVEAVAGEISHTWRIYRGDNPRDLEGVTVDLDSEIVTFSDPETGQELISVTFEQLIGAESEFWADRSEPGDHQALAFTRDGLDWTIQDIAADFGDDALIMAFEVANGRVVALVYHTGDMFRFTFGRFGIGGAAPGFEVWSAAIP
jgi:hypothetical protein